VLQLNYGIFIKFVRSRELVATVLTSSIVTSCFPGSCPTSASAASGWASYGWLRFIIFNDISTNWMVAWASTEFHAQLSLDVVISCPLLIVGHSFDYSFLLYLLSIGIKETLNLLSHLVSRLISCELLSTLLLLADKIPNIHVLITWKFTTRALSLGPILRQLLPVEVLGPFH
jgi:hypothetical protein